MTSAADRGRFGTIADLCRICARPENLKATTKIALAVGVLLTAINEGDTFASGQLTLALAVKVPLNFLVPFVVSNLGLLAARPERLTRRGRRP